MVFRAEADPLAQGSVPRRVRRAWRHGEGTSDAGGDPEQCRLLTIAVGPPSPPLEGEQSFPYLVVRHGHCLCLFLSEGTGDILSIHHKSY